MTGRQWLAWVVVAGLLAGCPGTADPKPPSDVDAERVAMLSREPVFDLAVGEPYVEVGFRDADKLHRGKVTADLNRVTDANDRDRTVEAMGALRDNGWTFFHTRCERDFFTASAYKSVDGVSFYAQIDGSEVQDGSNVVLRMRAPNSREPQQDLFAERPAALGVGETCLETDRTGASEGTAIILDEVGPDPDGAPKPAGHR